MDESKRRFRIAKSEGYVYGLRSEVSSAKAKIAEGLIKDNPGKSIEEVYELSRMVILEPEAYAEDAVKLVDRIEGGKLVKAHDKVQDKAATGNRGNISRAELIEAINSGTYTSEEYFTWIEDGARIIKSMNDGKVTEQDLDTKTDFCTQLDQREVELMVCLNLYRSSRLMEGESEESKRIKDRYEELRQKLNKLREVRSAVERTTKDEIDHEPTKEEYEQNIQIVFVMAEIGRHLKNGRYDEAEESRQNFRHALTPLMSEYDRMRLGLEPYDFEDESVVRKELENLNLKLQNNSLKSRTEFYAEYFRGREDALERSRDIRRKILSLQGIEKMKEEAVVKTILDTKFVEGIRKKQFDMIKYNILEKGLKYDHDNI